MNKSKQVISNMHQQTINNKQVVVNEQQANNNNNNNNKQIRTNQYLIYRHTSAKIQQ